jgi:hypothetical protein
VEVSLHVVDHHLIDLVGIRRQAAVNAGGLNREEDRVSDFGIVVEVLDGHAFLTRRRN